MDDGDRSTRSTSCARAGERRRARVPAGRARDPRDGRGAAQAPPARTPRSCRSTRGCRRRSRSACSSPHGGAAHRARHQRRRDLAHRAGHPLRRRHRARRASTATATATRSSSCRSSRSRRRRPTSAPAAAAASADGVCIRLYAEEDFTAAPAFTDPEILRTSLAAVILRMKALELGDVEDFPFLDPPAPRAIARRLRSCSHELGAVDENNQLTPIGRAAREAAVDPRIGRMILAAQRENCLAEIADHRRGAVGAGSARAAARARRARPTSAHEQFHGRAAPTSSAS